MSPATFHRFHSNSKAVSYLPFNKLSILTRRRFVMSIQNFSWELNSSRTYRALRKISHICHCNFNDANIFSFTPKDNTAIAREIRNLHQKKSMPQNTNQDNKVRCLSTLSRFLSKHMIFGQKCLYI